MEKYRHEFKYLISDADEMILRERLKGLVEYDKNAKDGLYKVRSLYFDDYFNRCYYDNVNGVDPRKKYRCRIYNGDSGYIKFECKKKERGKILKNGCSISSDICKKLIECESIGEFEDLPLVLREFLLASICDTYRPSVIVEYNRIAFVHDAGNVRITIDKDICSSADYDLFLNASLFHLRPVFSVGYGVLEIKWDDYIPDYIFEACQLNNLYQIACSKYCICRRFHE